MIATLHESIDAPDRALRRAVGGDGQARRECRARHADLASSTRSRTCARRPEPTSRPWPKAIGLDRRIGPAFLRAGIGFGGSCFPKDSLALKQLAANSGYNFQLLNAVIEVNELQKRRVIGKLERRLGPLRGKRIALLGLAFKPGTDDMREAPSLVLAGRLLSEGADVTAWDPVANGEAHLHGVEIAKTALDALDGADAAVVVTEWPELRELDWAAAAKRMRSTVIVDGRNLLDPDEMRSLGFTYEGIGRPVI